MVDIVAKSIFILFFIGFWALLAYSLFVGDYIIAIISFLFASIIIYLKYRFL